MTAQRIGVYICYCGGNISDYVDCERVRDAVEHEEGVAVARTTTFACSDAAQQEMIDDIQSLQLDGMVVASCSPTLHQLTFRGVAERAGLNPYMYTQVNLREQCSWAHTDDPEGATRKAIQLVRAGIANARFSEPLENLKVKTVPGVLVIGAGITGLRTALALSDLGLSVTVIERTERVGGWVGRFGRMYPHDRSGAELVAETMAEIERRDNITIHTRAELSRKSGSVGDLTAVIDIAGRPTSVNVGAIVVATGFETYHPGRGEYGYGQPGVITLPDFRTLLDKSQGPITHQGRPVGSIAYIYCVGSRCDSCQHGHAYCSRYCCAAAIHASLLVHERMPGLPQYHLYRDIRTYGKYEMLYTKARAQGSVFLEFDPEAPPRVEADGAGCRVVTTDVLTPDKELEIKADLVVLVTAMEPRPNEALDAVLKVPVGRDGFFKEVHPKLRPVETVIDGVLIAGAAQAPRSSAESVASALAAAVKGAALLKRGVVELEPLVAVVDPAACTWCGLCAAVCLYGALEKVTFQGKEVAVVNEVICKGGGTCVPVCPEHAIELRGSTDRQILAMIDAVEIEHV
jgi:heterodisulfide reductase subunit A